MQKLISTFRSCFLVLFAFLAAATAQAENYQGFTLEESKEIHQNFINGNWGESFHDWELKGKDSHYIFLHFSEFWPHSVINRAGPVTELPIVVREKVANFITKTPQGEFLLKDYVRNANVNGVVILHKGNIVFEDYPRMYPNDKHAYMSVSKTFVSTAIAILEDQKLLETNKSIDYYFPKLKGSDWEGVRVIDILDMSSGINCPWDLESQDSCFKESLLAYGWPGQSKALEDPLDSFKTMQANRPAGQVFEYADINTLVLTLLVEQISGHAFVDFLEREIWQKMGAESDALILNAAFGRAATPLGVSTSLRDMARYGLLFTPSGRKGSNNVVTEAYVQRIQQGGRPEILEATGPLDLYIYDKPITEEHLVDGEPTSHATYQWDTVLKDGDFFKGGSRGQGLYISPSRDLVIAYFGTHDEEEEVNLMPRISRQLAKSGLFDE